MRRKSAFPIRLLALTIYLFGYVIEYPPHTTILTHPFEEPELPSQGLLIPEAVLSRNMRASLIVAFEVSRWQSSCVPLTILTTSS